MNESRFDSIVRSFGRRGSRRHVLGAVLPFLAIVDQDVSGADSRSIALPARKGRKRRCSDRTPCADCQECAKGKCVPASNGTPCDDASDGRVCQDGACGCPFEDGGLCDGTCRDFRRDREHCGGCGSACAAGQSCCAGTCRSCADPCPVNETCVDGCCVCGKYRESVAPFTCCGSEGQCIHAGGPAGYLLPGTCDSADRCPDGHVPCEGLPKGCDTPWEPDTCFCKTCCPPGTICNEVHGYCMQAAPVGATGQKGS